MTPTKALAGLLLLSIVFLKGPAMAAAPDCNSMADSRVSLSYLTTAVDSGEGSPIRQNAGGIILGQDETFIYVATPYHVVNRWQDPHVIFHFPVPDEPLVQVLPRHDETNDVAFLRIFIHGKQPKVRVVTQSRKVNVGTRVSVIAEDSCVLEVNTIRSTQPGIAQITSTGIGLGDSGNPVLDDKGGLIGMITSVSATYSRVIGTAWLFSLAAETNIPRNLIANEPRVLFRAKGSTTVGEALMPALVAKFLESKGAIQVAGGERDSKAVTGVLEGEPVQVNVDAVGSPEAFKCLGAKEDGCDIGMSSRRINEAELAALKGLGDMTSPETEHTLSLDGIAIVTNRNNPVTAMPKDLISDVFHDPGNPKVLERLRNLGWPVNGPVRLCGRRDGQSGTFDSFKALFMDNQSIAPSASESDKSGEIENCVIGATLSPAQAVNSIGYVSASFVRTTNALAVSEPGIAAMKPTSASIASEAYLGSRRLYLYSKPGAPVFVREFLKFVQQREAQDLADTLGFTSQNLKLGGGNRIAVAFRFTTGGARLDNRALTDIGRVAEMMHSREYAGSHLVAVGFTDNQQNLRPGGNCALSLSRAQSVAEALKEAGLDRPATAGMCDQLPVRSNATEAGREHNRRVELWIVP